MRNITLLFICLTSAVFAQVTLSASQINFGDVFTKQSKEIGVDVSNAFSQPVSITQVKVYDSAFSYTISSTTIEPNKSQKFRISFKPRHNIVYNSELIFSLTNGSEYRIDLIGNGRFTDSYYDATFNKSHQDLKDALKTILAANYVNYGYNGARDKMYAEIDNVGGNVTCVYTGRVATFNTRTGATSQNFNCEHTWPQSLFSQNEPERADIHHLFSTDETANGKRGNLPFGIVSNASWSEGGSKLGSSVFEPRDAHKGATARAMLYFVLRYQDYSNFIDNQEVTLIEWHKNFQPSTTEIARNEKIYFYQKNRNPMIDHPEFIERIGKFGSTDTKPLVKKADVLQQNIQFGNITTTEERIIYVTNTGNQLLTSYSVTTTSGKILVSDIESTMTEGESAKITMRASSLAQGTYTDTLVVDLSQQSGQKLTIPIQFSVGLSGLESLQKKKLQVHYNATQHLLRLVDAPEGLNDVQVYTSTGKQVFNEISTSFTDIPTIAFAPGVYFVVIYTKTEVYTTKVLVY